uniref:Secreted protein n=1 Tax=Trypanosoma congolense (strain IL3000) TaxID=1068625 RepID=G0US21_TRYCI|nr:hypothetical protein, unlikely [Trypanosoma congolense IL3000]
MFEVAWHPLFCFLLAVASSSGLRYYNHARSNEVEKINSEAVTAIGRLRMRERERACVCVCVNHFSFLTASYHTACFLVFVWPGVEEACSTRISTVISEIGPSTSCRRR